MAEGGLRRIFLIPAVIGAITFVGLLAALLGGKAWEPVSWIALGAPIAVIGWRILGR